MKAFGSVLRKEIFGALRRLPMQAYKFIFHGLRSSFNRTISALTSYLLLVLSGLCGCSNPPMGGSFITDIEVLARYDRKILTRPDGSYLNCFISKTNSEKPLPLVFFCQGFHTFNKGSRCPAGITPIPIYLVEGGGKKHRHMILRSDFYSCFKNGIGIGTNCQQRDLGAAFPEGDYLVD